MGIWAIISAALGHTVMHLTVNLPETISLLGFGQEKIRLIWLPSDFAFNFFPIDL